MYAERPELKFNKENTIKTVSGGAASLLTIAAIVSCAAFLAKRLFLHELPLIQSSYLQEDLRRFGNVSANDMAFDFAFELRDRNMSPVPFDKTYFSIETSYELGTDDS